MNIIGALNAAIRICEKLHTIHSSNVFHGNLNSDTISVDSSNNIFLLTNDSTKKITQYTSPEQTGRIKRTVDYRTDLYSLGVFLYNRLTSNKIFDYTDEIELVHSIIAKSPNPPNIINPQIPKIVSDIIMKLVSKNAEDRYQSVIGLKYDLEKIIIHILDDIYNLSFIPGENDISEYFEISQKLYGRSGEINILLDKFNESIKGKTEILMITGYSGVGKTSLVNEINRHVALQNGYFISGKFDQYKHDYPYFVLIQAFQQLIQQILTESAEKLFEWKNKIQSALSINGQIVLDVIPDLELVIGEQPDVIELTPAESQIRFNYVFECFIEVFAAKDHPLIIFLDDLQWADSATLKFIDLLIMNPENKHLLLIGAYRNNEADNLHSLILRLKEIENQRGVINTIVLRPLPVQSLQEIIIDSFKCDSGKALQLADLCYMKTEGNPFYFKQFLKSLHDENIIFFDSKLNSWEWDIDDVKAMNLTDNLAQFMIKKIRNLSLDAQDALKYAAAIGNHFNVAVLQHLMRKSASETVDILSMVCRENLVVKLDKEKYYDYKFAHDQIQKASYSLIETDETYDIHLKIGRLMQELFSESQLEDNLFDLVNHLNMGSKLIVNPDEKLSLAKNNLKTALKAKGSIAYSDAYRYLETAKSLLPENSWDIHRQLTTDIYHLLIETSYLIGDLEKMESYIHDTNDKITDLLDRVKINNSRIYAYYSVSKPFEAVNLSFETLRLLGTYYPENVQPADIQTALESIHQLLAGRTVEELLNLPPMEDAQKIQTLKLIANMLHSIYFVAPQYYPLLAVTFVDLSVKFGNASESIIGYVLYGFVLCAMENDYERGYEFGVLAGKLLQKTGNKEFKAKTILIFNNLVAHWKQHVNLGIPLLREGHLVGLETGDMPYAVDCAHSYIFSSFFAGKQITWLKTESDHYLTKLQKLRQDNSLHFIIMCIYHQSFENLLSKDVNNDLLIGEKFNENLVDDDFKKTRGMTALFVLYSFKVMLGLTFGIFDNALDNLKKANDYIMGVISTYHIPYFAYIESLTLLALMKNSDDPIYSAHINKVLENRDKLKNWAIHAPMNHQNKYLLVEAEIARVERRLYDAIDFYDLAISSARENEFIQHEALANECAGKFWLSLKKEKFAQSYLSEAHRCYRKWGADAKTKQLEKQYPELINANELQYNYWSSPQTISNTNYDANTIIKASQALSSETKLPELIKKLMTIALENAGAEKGFLILKKNKYLFIEAEAGNKQLLNLISENVEDCGRISKGIIHYVARTCKQIVLDDAAVEGDYTMDQYISENSVKSLLCIPLMSQGDLIGILYLENNLVTGAFSPDRVDVLKIIISQASAFIEKARLYEGLERKIDERTSELKQAKEKAEEGERLFTQLLEHSPIYIFLKDSDLRLIRVSPNFENIIGKPARDCIGKTMHELFEKDFADKIVADDKKIIKEGKVFELEEMLNGRIYNTIKFPIYMEGKSPYLAGFNIDITERKHADKEIRKAKEIAETATISKSIFLANMSHEIRTPLNAIVNMSKLLTDESLNDNQKEYNDIVLQASDMLLTLVNDILDFSKIEAGKLDIENIAFSLNDVVNTVHKILKIKSDEKGLRFSIITDRLLHNFIKGDPNRLKQILLNLLNNSIKFTHKGEVKLSISVVDDKVDRQIIKFEISDTGIGISEKKLKTLFAPFEQGDTSITRKYGGTGLGLSISKKLIDLIGGQIEIISKLGEGTSVWFTIEFEKSSELEIPQRKDIYKTENKFYESLKILLVEDNDLNQKVASTIFEKMKIKCEIANNGVAALQILETRKFDMIFMDIEMPEMDGYEAVQRIRKLKTDVRNIPIVAMTAHVMKNGANNIVNSGMNDYIFKPIDINEISRVINHYILNDGKETNHNYEEKRNIPNKLDENIVFDKKEFLNRIKDNMDVYDKLIKLASMEIPKKINKIKQALDVNNFDNIYDAAHELKGVALNISASALTDVLTEMEDYCSEKDLNNILKIYSLLKKEEIKLLEAIK